MTYPDKTTTTIPPALAELGVVSVTILRNGYDVKYRFDFADGDLLIFQEQPYQWGDRAKSEGDLLGDALNAIHAYQVLPFG
jgi:hypothetical protein